MGGIGRKGEPVPPAKGDTEIMAHILGIRMTFTENVLGTSPSDPDVYRQFIAPAVEDTHTADGGIALAKEAKAEREAECIENGNSEDDGRQGVTVFPRDSDGNPFIYDYQIKGFLKDACGGLRRVPGTACSKVKAYKKIIDTCIFPLERTIPIIGPDGNPPKVGLCSRPLRAQTAQGDRVAIATSEEIPEGSSVKFRLLCAEKDGLSIVSECFSYGRLRGFGQWRNSGKGRFAWELYEFDFNEVRNMTVAECARKWKDLPLDELLANPKISLGL